MKDTLTLVAISFCKYELPADFTEVTRYSVSLDFCKFWILVLQCMPECQMFFLLTWHLSKIFENSRNVFVIISLYVIVIYVCMYKLYYCLVSLKCIQSFLNDSQTFVFIILVKYSSPDSKFLLSLRNLLISNRWSSPLPTIHLVRTRGWSATSSLRLRIGHGGCGRRRADLRRRRPAAVTRTTDITPTVD